MSAEVLRRAAALIREAADSNTCCGDIACDDNWYARFLASVADWLEESADHLDAHDDAPGFPRDAVCPTALEGLECSVLGQALKVARAYLGEQP